MPTYILLANLQFQYHARNMEQENLDCSSVKMSHKYHFWMHVLEFNCYLLHYFLLWSDLKTLHDQLLIMHMHLDHSKYNSELVIEKILYSKFIKKSQPLNLLYFISLFSNYFHSALILFCPIYFILPNY